MKSECAVYQPGRGLQNDGHRRRVETFSDSAALTCEAHNVRFVKCVAQTSVCEFPRETQTEVCAALRFVKRQCAAPIYRNRQNLNAYLSSREKAPLLLAVDRKSVV